MTIYDAIDTAKRNRAPVELPLEMAQEIAAALERIPALERAVQHDYGICWVNRCALRADGNVHVELRRAYALPLRVVFAVCSEHLDQFEQRHEADDMALWWVERVWRAKEADRG